MRIFFDANVILDRFDLQRPYYKYSKIVYEYCLLSKFDLYTSCDLITTIYYINAKNDKVNSLNNIQNLIKTLKVIDFSNQEVEQTCELMLKDNDYKDLEDTLQYIMAQKESCELIISNDKVFVSKDIEVLTSKEFYEKYIKENNDETTDTKL